MKSLVGRNYHVAGGMISQSREHFWMSIPKNASTFTANVLKSNGWEHFNLADEGVKNVIVVLRDPVERWVSGFTTYASRYLLGYGYGSLSFVEDYNELVKKFIFDNINFDDHTEPQSTYVGLIPNKFNKIYVRCDDGDIIEKLSKITGQSLPYSVSLQNNSKDSNDDTQRINEFMSKQLTTELINKLKTYYQEDYYLLERV